MRLEGIGSANEYITNGRLKNRELWNPGADLGNALWASISRSCSVRLEQFPPYFSEEDIGRHPSELLVSSLPPPDQGIGGFQKT